MEQSYSVSEVASLLNCSRPTVYQQEKRGLLKRVEDPHNLFGGLRFERESVEQLKREMELLEHSGSSITEVATRLNVYSHNVKKAIESLELQINIVPTTMHSSKQRYSITPEQEKLIEQHLKQKKSRRIKRNHLYFSTLDVALYQVFSLAGEQQIRLLQNDHMELGFSLGPNEFIPYDTAMDSLLLEPLYPIHQERQPGNHGFTDLAIGVDTDGFYQVLDLLYTMFGVENFNAEIQGRQLIASIRNGRYSIPSNAPQEALQVLRSSITAGKVDAATNTHWSFTHGERAFLLSLDEEVYSALKEQAAAKGLTFKEWAEELLEGELKHSR